MASGVNFLDMLTLLEDTFEFNKDGKLHEYSQETILIFRNLKNFIVGCSWTDNPHYRFIVENKSLSSEELAIKYASLNNGKQKAAATFRVQRAEVCRILAGLFGNNLNEVFFTQNQEELRQVKNKIALFTNGVVDVQVLFPDFVMDKMKKNVISSKYIDIKDCSKEIIILSKLTTENIKSELSALDPDKLSYIYSLLNSDFIRQVEGKYIINQDRLYLLSELNAYSEQQRKIPVIKEGNSQLEELQWKYSNLEREYKNTQAELFGQRDNIRKEFMKQITELQRENNELRKKYEIFKRQAGELADKNSKLTQVVELYTENDNENTFKATEFSDEDLYDDSFLSGGAE